MPQAIENVGYHGRVHRLRTAETLTDNRWRHTEIDEVTTVRETGNVTFESFDVSADLNGCCSARQATVLRVGVDVFAACVLA